MFFLPWQIDIAHSLLRNKTRLPHAWLIYGAKGIGKKNFALAVAASLLCESKQQKLACGNCIGCSWFLNGNHPDFQEIYPDILNNQKPLLKSKKDQIYSLSNDIRINQIRDLDHWLNIATHRDGRRVILLYPAHMLNIASSNALLKILEEPPKDTIFLLVTPVPSQLQLTIISRCQRLSLPIPKTDIALQWLKDQGIEKNPDDWLSFCGGSPLSVLSLSKEYSDACPDWLYLLVQSLANGIQININNLIKSLGKTSIENWIDILQKVYIDIMLIQSSGYSRYFPMLKTELTTVINNANYLQVLRMATWLRNIRKFSNNRSLNSKLLSFLSIKKVIESLSKIN